jgi:hypothetical protein
MAHVENELPALMHPEGPAFSDFTADARLLSRGMIQHQLRHLSRFAISRFCALDNGMIERIGGRHVCTPNLKETFTASGLSMTAIREREALGWQPCVQVQKIRVSGP